MSPPDTAAVMLLVSHLLALGVAAIIFAGMFYLQRRQRQLELHFLSADHSETPAPESRPASWLAIRSVASETVRKALPDPLSFSISPYVNGWVIVSGPGLPDPDEDVDDCFRFLVGLSRKMGHVQFYYTEPFSAHHAWARLDDGCVTRAYAWAGQTIWQQGAPTVVERQLGLTCFDYGDEPGVANWMTREVAAANLEKMPRLAARWSVDPAAQPRSNGITGESSRPY